MRAVGTASTFFIFRTQQRGNAELPALFAIFPSVPDDTTDCQVRSRQHYAGGRAIKSRSLGSASATVRGRPKLAANTSGGFEATHALRSWE